MKKFIAGLALLGFALGIGIQPASAAEAPKSEQLVSVKVFPGGGRLVTVDGVVKLDTRKGGRQAAGPFNNNRFYDNDICLHNLIGTTWDIGGAGNAWEGVNSVQTGYRSAAQGCTGYPAAQSIRFYTYSEADGACLTYTGYTTSTGPWAYYNQLWTGTGGGPKIFMNTYYFAALGCRDTAQHRNYNISQAIGEVLGMAVFNNPYSSSIMNEIYWDTYSFAGTFDRNNAWNKYNCPGAAC